VARKPISKSKAVTNPTDAETVDIPASVPVSIKE